MKYMWLFYIELFLSHRPEKMVWHGADSQGNKMNDKECSDWRSDSASNVGYAGSLTSGKLVDMHEFSCRKELIVLCIEVLPKTQRKPYV